MNSALFEALEIERIAMFVVLSHHRPRRGRSTSLSSLIMLVRAKTRDIAILRTMGASRGAMMRMFMTVGADDRLARHLLGLILGAIFLFFRQGVVNLIQLLTGQNLVGPVGALPDRTAVEDRSVRSRRDLVVALAAVLPRDLYPGVEGGRHRSGPGAAL